MHTQEGCSPPSFPAILWPPWPYPLTSPQGSAFGGGLTPPQTALALLAYPAPPPWGLHSGTGEVKALFPSEIPFISQL